MPLIRIIFAGFMVLLQVIIIIVNEILKHSIQFNSVSFEFTAITMHMILSALNIAKLIPRFD